MQPHCFVTVSSSCWFGPSQVKVQAGSAPHWKVPSCVCVYSHDGDSQPCNGSNHITLSS
jgi:hypothetical protein